MARQAPCMCCCCSIKESFTKPWFPFKKSVNFQNIPNCTTSYWKVTIPCIQLQPGA